MRRGLIRWQLETTGSDLLGRPVDVAEVSFNPFTLDTAFVDLQVHHPGRRETQASAGRIDLRPGWSNLWQRTLIIEAIEARDVRISIVRDSTGTLDLQDVIDRLHPTTMPPTMDCASTSRACACSRVKSSSTRDEATRVDVEGRLDDSPRRPSDRRVDDRRSPADPCA